MALYWKQRGGQILRESLMRVIVHLQEFILGYLLDLIGGKETRRSGFCVVGRINTATD